MADKKLTDATITLLAHPAKGDYLYIVSDPAGSPISKKIYTENAMESLNLGWLWVAASGTYLSDSTFRVTGDFTAYFKIGAKIKLSNTTTKYFYVASSSYSSPYTTITIVVNTTHVLTNTTITNIYLSYAEPPDFPGAFTYSPTYTPQNGTFTSVRNLDVYFQISNKLLNLIFSFDGTLSIASSYITMSLPLAVVHTQLSFPCIGGTASFLTSTSLRISATFAAAAYQGASGMVCVKLTG